MSEDSDLEKTELPSPRKLEKAREEGQVPRSRELATLLSLLAAAGGFWLWGAHMAHQIQRLLRQGLSFDHQALIDPQHWFIHTSHLALDLALSLLPWVLAILVAALLSPMLMGGWLFHGASINPNFSKLNPLKGLSNMFSKNAALELIKALGKTLLVALIVWWTLTQQLDDMLQLSHGALEQSSKVQAQLFLNAFTAMVAALALIAMIDAPYQWWSFRQKLMMTRQEIKDEAKESEGNPEIKAQIRAQQREMARRRMMANIPTADVVVTNPTHYAVALKYPEHASTAPLVVAKGMDEVAEKIKAIAREHKVLIMEAPPLARALYTHTDIDEEIPRPLYTAVAQVLAYVFQLKANRQHGAPPPDSPQAIEVPADMDPLNKQISSTHAGAWQ